jgi:hypothetical protein
VDEVTPADSGRERQRPSVGLAHQHAAAVAGTHRPFEQSSMGSHGRVVAAHGSPSFAAGWLHLAAPPSTATAHRSGGVHRSLSAARQGWPATVYALHCGGETAQLQNEFASHVVPLQSSGRTHVPSWQASPGAQR